jgi:hypothetical protein
VHQISSFTFKKRNNRLQTNCCQPFLAGGASFSFCSVSTGTKVADSGRINNKRGRGEIKQSHDTRLPASSFWLALQGLTDWTDVDQVPASYNPTLVVSLTTRKGFSGPKFTCTSLRGLVPLFLLLSTEGWLTYLNWQLTKSLPSKRLTESQTTGLLLFQTALGYDPITATRNGDECN